jgi:hypothetical protein
MGIEYWIPRINNKEPRIIRKKSCPSLASPVAANAYSPKRVKNTRRNPNRRNLFVFMISGFKDQI